MAVERPVMTSSRERKGKREKCDKFERERGRKRERPSHQQLPNRRQQRGQARSSSVARGDSRRQKISPSLAAAHLGVRLPEVAEAKSQTGEARGLRKNSWQSCLYDSTAFVRQRGGDFLSLGLYPNPCMQALFPFPLLITALHFVSKGFGFRVRVPDMRTFIYFIFIIKKKKEKKKYLKIVWIIYLF